MAEAPAPIIEPLDTRRHGRDGFCSGVPELDRYLLARASQDARRRVAAPFVLVLPPSQSVVGYYTLSNATVLAAELPTEVTKRLPRYPLLPATLLGRLAVDERHRGAGLGTLLLLNALRRALRSEVASMAVLVDAKDEGAAAFYRRHDFQHLPDHPRRMFLPMAEVAAMFAEP
jgi:GNAT superfamily N-acetyltransferase